MTPGLQYPEGVMESSGATAEIPFEMVFAKMERLVREMQHPETGVPVRSQKLFLSSIPYAFTGYDIVEWIMDRLGIDDYPEAVHLANLLCQHGYFFPVNEAKSLTLKDDHALYRFQTPYFWPSHHQPDNTDYAIFLSKRTMRSKQKHGLEEYEQEALLRLKKLLCHKWDFISMQAEEQANLAKERKKTDKIVIDSQEKAYWRVHKPPPGCTSCLERSPISNRKLRRKRSKEDVALELEVMKRCLNRTSCKSSQGISSLIQYFDAYMNYDPFISGCLPSNPWVTEDPTLWMLNARIVDVPTEKRVRRWSISLQALLSDPTGVREFELYLQKEYSGENLRFWQAVQRLKKGAQKEVSDAAKKLLEEFLSPGAPYEVNLDSRTVEETLEEVQRRPTRTTFDAAQRHVFALMDKDTYPRFLRSDHYQALLLNAGQHPHKKKFFHFGTKKKIPTSPSQGKRTTGGSPNGGSGGTSSLSSGTVLGVTSSAASTFGTSNSGILTERERRLSSGQQLSGSNIDLTSTPKGAEVFEDWPFSGRHSHSTSDLRSLHESSLSHAGSRPIGGSVNAGSAHGSFCKIPVTNRMSSPSISRDCLSQETGAATLQVPRWSHRSSEEASTCSSPEDSGELDQDTTSCDPTSSLSEPLVPVVLIPGTVLLGVHDAVATCQGTV